MDAGLSEIDGRFFAGARKEGSARQLKILSASQYLQVLTGKVAGRKKTALAAESSQSESTVVLSSSLQLSFSSLQAVSLASRSSFVR